jgi:hypothetical protein
MQSIDWKQLGTRLASIFTWQQLKPKKENEEKLYDYMGGGDVIGCTNCKIREEEILYLRGMLRDVLISAPIKLEQSRPESSRIAIKRGRINTPSNLRKQFEIRSREERANPDLKHEAETAETVEAVDSDTTNEDVTIANLEKELGIKQN